jgi:hypothetical protein
MLLSTVILSFSFLGYNIIKKNIHKKQSPGSIKMPEQDIKPQVSPDVPKLMTE